MCYRCMIKPAFGDKDYAELKMADLQDFINQKYKRENPGRLSRIR